MTPGRPAHKAKPLKDFLERWADACAREHLRETGEDCADCEDFNDCQKWGDRVIKSIMHAAKRGR